MSIRDVIYSGCISRDLSVLRAELNARHRVRERRFLIDYLPAESTGVELGVFTGLFSGVLSRQQKFSKLTFVDPWWLAHGECYSDWGSYTDFGRLKTRQAWEAARRRILNGHSNRTIEVAFSQDWLECQPDESLDWAYIDSSHAYDGTWQELRLLNSKIRRTGLICGDDWRPDRNNKHHGVSLAVNEFVRAEGFEFVMCGVNDQWIIRRKLKDASALTFVRHDEDYARVRLGKAASEE
jgi:hypothetical protein